MASRRQFTVRQLLMLVAVLALFLAGIGDVKRRIADTPLAAALELMLLVNFAFWSAIWAINAAASSPAEKSQD
jgi:hypothetical protein